MPTARAWAFADDLVVHGYAERLLDHIDDYKQGAHRDGTVHQQMQTNALSC